MFSKLINRIHNPKHFLYIIFVASIVFSVGHLNLLGFGFSILAFLGLKNNDISYLKAFIAYNIIELIFYSISEFFFFIILLYEGYLLITQTNFDNEVESEEIEIIFGFSFLYSVVSFLFIVILAKLFTIELLKKYIAELEPVKDFSLLESGNSDYSNNSSCNSNEKLNCREKAYIDKSSKDTNDFLPQYKEFN